MSGRETTAENLWPGDRIRRGFRVFHVDRIEVSNRSPVRLVVHRINGTDRVPESENLDLPIGEIVQRVEA